jgi:hypothetical protein
MNQFYFSWVCFVNSSNATSLHSRCIGGGGGVKVCHSNSRLNRIDRILIPLRYTFFSGSPPVKNFGVKHAWPRAISGWVIDREVFPGVHK